MSSGQAQPLRVSLTNVTGLGASVLARSLVTAFEASPTLRVSKYYVPDASQFAQCGTGVAGKLEVYHRKLPNAVSRVLECTVLAGHFDGPEPLLVMGDLPVATRARQIVFVQSAHLISDVSSNGLVDRLRYRIARSILRRNQRHVAAFVVQSEIMRTGLAETYGIDRNRIHVISQPPPAWLLESGLARRSESRKRGQRLRLFYPAAAYPHKNHDLIAGARGDPSWPELIETLTLTIEPELCPVTEGWVDCAGQLDAAAVVEAYRQSDALVFLSKTESLGFPLIEAMWVGLPIVCPDLAYAHTLCGEQAIYFDPGDLASLKQALMVLRTRLDDGWWPDWTAQLEQVPSGWDDVAGAFSEVIASL